MLFACLQRHAKCAVVFGIDANANNSTRHCSFEIFFRGEKGSVSPAISQWNTKTLSRTNGNISPEFTWWSEQSQSEKICSHSHVAAGIVNVLNELTIVLYRPNIIWV